MDTPHIINWLLFLAVVVYAIYLFAYILRTRVAFIKLGKRPEFEQTVKEKWHRIWVNVFGQKKLLKDKKSGAIHVMMFYGFIFVQFGAIDLIWKGLAPGSHLPFGPIYKPFTFFQELIVLMILMATVWAFYRRYVEKLVRLKRGFKSGLVLLFISGLMVCTLLANGADMLARSDMHIGWGQPAASAIAWAFQWIGASAAQAFFFIFWWGHLLFLLTFLVYVPQSKHAHLIFGPVNTWLGGTYEKGRLQPIDFEDENKETFGVNKIEDFDQKQLVDLYACVECGRCTNVCPAAGTGKMLSPMDLIIRLRDHLTEQGAAITSRTPWMPSYAFTGTDANQQALAARRQGKQESAAAAAEQLTGSDPSELIGHVITEEEIWACTSCRACEDQCPVSNEHVDKIIDMRRHLVMMEGKMPSDTKHAMTNIERQGNPWGLSRKERENWRDGRDDIDVPTVKELEKAGKDFDYLFWVGSMDAYDNRSQKIAMSLAKVMNEAGISFAILGNKEKNSGDTPRRIGNEFLFQELAAKNIETFQKYGVKKIITTDPHAYHTIKNEYPDFGLDDDVEVYHHTALLAKWVQEGRIQPTYEVNETITYHDSCYLGRYNDVYEPPRDVLKAIPGVEVVEMDRHRERGMCCGAGGGLMWTEEKVGSRINVARTEQALATDAGVIASACPYCLTMLGDGTKAKAVEEDVQTNDIAELLERSIVGPGKASAG